MTESIPYPYEYNITVGGMLVDTCHRMVGLPGHFEVRITPFYRGGSYVDRGNNASPITIPRKKEVLERFIKVFQAAITDIEAEALARGLEEIRFEHTETGICRKRDPETGQELRRESG